MGAAAVIAAVLGFIYYRDHQRRLEGSSSTNGTLPSNGSGGKGAVVPPSFPEPAKPLPTPTLDWSPFGSLQAFQLALTSLGFPTTATGSWNSGTKAQVAAFQSHVNKEFDLTLPLSGEPTYNTRVAAHTGLDLRGIDQWPYPQGEPQPQPQPQPQPEPPPQSVPAATVDQALEWAGSKHPDLTQPSVRVYTERHPDLDASGYSYGLDVYSDGVTHQNGQYIGFVNAASNKGQSAIWSYRDTTIPAVRDKLTYYASILKGNL